MLSIVKILTACTYYSAITLYTIHQAAIVDRDIQISLAVKPSISSPYRIAALCLQIAVTLHDIVRIQVVKIRIEIIDAGTRQPHAVLQSQGMGLCQFHIYFYRRHYVSIMARIVSLCSYWTAQILDILIGIFVTQSRHHREQSPTIGIAQIGSQYVITVFVVIAPIVVMRPVCPLHTIIV